MLNSSCYKFNIFSSGPQETSSFSLLRLSFIASFLFASEAPCGVGYCVKTYRGLDGDRISFSEVLKPFLKPEKTLK